jgi:hypothetical protein
MFIIEYGSPFLVIAIILDDLYCSSEKPIDIYV